MSPASESFATTETDSDTAKAGKRIEATRAQISASDESRMNVTRNQESFRVRAFFKRLLEIDPPCILAVAFYYLSFSSQWMAGSVWALQTVAGDIIAVSA